MSWIEVTAQFVAAPADWSLAVEAFVKNGCENTLQDSSEPKICGCVAETPVSAAVISSLKQDLELLGASVEVRSYEEEDWEESWKRFFKPRRVGQSIVICPSWERADSQLGDVVISLDPGQAFGTGEHATTTMCLELLETVPLTGTRVLDFGCGSGILAIAAAKLGAATVHAIDCDPVAVGIAAENARLNGVQIGASVGTVVLAESDRLDLILSNLISATLMQVASDVHTSLKPGGIWIASGILDGNWPHVEQAANEAGFETQEVLQEDGWVAAMFSR